VKEYDIFLPLRYNDGEPVEAAKFQALQAELLQRFGGVTYFPQANQGLWKAGAVTYRDEIVIYRVLTGSRGARRFLLRLKARLMKEFAQEEILIVERSVDAL
jgi:hypothetical protein